MIFFPSFHTVQQFKNGAEYSEKVHRYIRRDAVHCYYWSLFQQGGVFLGSRVGGSGGLSIVLPHKYLFWLHKDSVVFVTRQYTGKDSFFTAVGTFLFLVFCRLQIIYATRYALVAEKKAFYHTFAFNLCTGFSLKKKQLLMLFEMFSPLRGFSCHF